MGLATGATGANYGAARDGARSAGRGEAHRLQLKLFVEAEATESIYSVEETARTRTPRRRASLQPVCGPLRSAPLSMYTSANAGKLSCRDPCAPPGGCSSTASAFAAPDWLAGRFTFSLCQPGRRHLSPTTNSAGQLLSRLVRLSSACRGSVLDFWAFPARREG